MNELRSFLSSIFVKRDQPRTLAEWWAYRRAERRLIREAERRRRKKEKEKTESAEAPIATEEPAALKPERAAQLDTK